MGDVSSQRVFPPYLPAFSSGVGAVSARARRFLAAAWLLGITGCTTPHFPVIHPVEETNKIQMARMRAEEYFVKAREYDLRGMPQMAETFYRMASELDPESRMLRELLAEKYLQFGKYAQALLTIKAGRTTDSFSEKELKLLSMIYVKTGRYEEAVEMLELMEPKGDQDYYSLGLLNESLGRNGNALKYYRDYFKRSPESDKIGLKIAALLLKMDSTAAADDFLNELETRFGQSAELLNFLGTMSVHKGDTAEAIRFFKMALITDSTSEEAMRSLAQLYIRHSEYAQAIPYYERLFSIQPWGEIYGKTLGLLYYYEDRLNDAEKLLMKLLGNNSNDYELHYYLGLVAGAQERGDLARLQLQKSIALHNVFPDAWRQLCFLAIRDEDWDEALEHAQRFSAAMKDYSISWRTLGSVYNARKEYARAADALRKALEIDSADSYAWFELGSSFERQRQVDSAEYSFKKVLQLKPGDPVAANYLGYMWAERGMKLDSAKALIELALSKEPENGAYLDSYAWVFFQMGDDEQAYHYMIKAIEKIDNDAVVFDHLGDILDRRGDLAGALAAWEKCLELEPEDRDSIEKKIADVKSRLKSPEEK